MERRMNTQDVVRDMQQGIELVQGDEAVIIEQENGTKLVLVTEAAFNRLKAGQRNPGKAPIETAGGQRNPG